MDDGINHDYDSECPHCGHSPICWRDCTELGCEDGFMDAHDDDSINYAPGELIYKCNECNGTGTISWCPGCGKGIEHPILEEEEIEIEILNYSPNMKNQTVYIEIANEIEKAEIKHPDWPTDVIYALSIMIEEAGEAMRAAVQFQLEGGDIRNVRKELLETAAMCVRAIEHLPI